MGNATKSLSSLLEHLDNETLVLPEIQREFVWRRKHIIKLIDSLFRGLPIGTVLVWKARTEVRKKPTYGKKGRVGKKIENFYGYLLDGQQRLTAIRLVRDDVDNYPLMFNLLTDGTDEEEPFAWRARWNENSPWYIPVARVLDEDFSVMELHEELKQYEEYDHKKHGDHIFKTTGRLREVLKYPIGVIEYDEDDYQKATELFIRFNSTGKRLSKPELALAQLALAAPNMVTDGLGRVEKSFPGFEFTKPFLLQCLVAIHTGRMKITNPHKLWENSSDTDIRKAWQRTEKGISRAVEFLTGTIRWDGSAWIPSMVTLIPLIFIFAHRKPGRSDREVFKKWFLLSNLRSLFAGGGYHIFDTLFKYLGQSPSVDTLWRYTHRYMKPLKVHPDDLDISRKHGPAMSLYISLLRNRNAVDWKRGTPLNGRVIGDNAELQVHHFFPQALLKKEGYDSEDINTFANYTIICKDTNLDIRKEEPAVYLERLNIKKGHLRTQCIPLDKSLWKVERYREFLKTRRKLLSRELNVFLG